MKMFFATIALLIGVAGAASAMPCDAGYKCISKSGRYEITLRRCHYENRLTLIELQSGKTKVSKAKLGAAWDGDNMIAFEIFLPAQAGESQRRLSVEIPRKGHAGMLREESQEYNPGPWKIVRSESVNCEIDE